MGKNKSELLSAEVELGSFGPVITNIRTSQTQHSWIFLSQKSTAMSPLSICWLTVPEFSFPNPSWKINCHKSGCRKLQLLNSPSLSF